MLKFENHIKIKQCFFFRCMLEKDVVERFLGFK